MKAKSLKAISELRNMFLAANIPSIQPRRLLQRHLANKLVALDGREWRHVTRTS